jgi:hypothetical protein
VKVSEGRNQTLITFQQPQLERLGTESPIADDRFTLTSPYRLQPGRITRTDVYTLKGALAIKSLRMEFATCSGIPTRLGTTITFGRGAARKFAAFGFERCEVASVQDDVAYHTPTGPFATRVISESPPLTVRDPLKVGWTLSHQ